MVDVGLLATLETTADGFLHSVGETRVNKGVLSLFGDEGVQVVPEEVSAVHAPVPVEDSKVGRFLPVGGMFWFGKVEDDGHSVLVVLADWPLVGRGRVGSYGAMSILGVLGGLEVTDGHQHLRQQRMVILMGFDAPLFNMEGLGVDEDLLSDDLICMSHWGLGLRTWLVLVAVLDC